MSTDGMSTDGMSTDGKSDTETQSKGRIDVDATYVIKRPVLTELSTSQMEDGTYTFIVDRRADKPVIRSAVETLYDVKVKSIRTATTKHRDRRYRYGRIAGGVTKKAIIRLEEGHAIELF